MSRITGAIIASLFFGSLGCDFEDRSHTIIDNLRVLGTQISPPEVGYDDQVLETPALFVKRGQLEISAMIVDPSKPNQTLDVSIVACTELDGTCLETLQYQLLGDPFSDEAGVLTEVAYHDYFSAHAWRGTVTLDGVSAILSGAELSTFEGYAYYLRDLDILEMDARVAILVCPVGTCSAFAELDAYLADENAPGGAALLRQLATAEGSVEQGKLQDIAFARKAYRISQRPPDQVNHNPFIEQYLLNGQDIDGDSIPDFSGYAEVGMRVDIASFDEVKSLEGEVLGYEALSVSFYSSAGTLDTPSAQIPFGSREESTLIDLGESTGNPAYLWSIVKDSRGGQAFGEVKLGRN